MVQFIIKPATRMSVDYAVDTIQATIKTDTSFGRDVPRLCTNHSFKWGWDKKEERKGSDVIVHASTSPSHCLQ